MEKTRCKNCKGFTLVELLVALIITSIILPAVVTLAYAMATARERGDDTSQKQTQVRYATLRISELIRQCSLICAAGSNNLAVWRADDNDDGKINIEELVYIETESSTNGMQLAEFTPPGMYKDTTLEIDGLKNGTTTSWLKDNCEITYTALIPECSNVQFAQDSAPPWSKFVSTSFELVENGTVHHYQINAALRGWAGHLLDSSGNIVVSDDD